MAGNKINTKTKGKDDKNKTTKTIVQPNDDSEDMDFSLLRKPILTSITGFAQARKIFDLATEELKDLLSNECDLLYECKVCRNIFRSLANFISHKRVYCTERFNSSLHGHFFKTASTVSEMLKIKKLEESYLEAMKNKNGYGSVDPDEIDSRIPFTKDLTTIIEKMVRNKGENELISEEQNMILQKIPNSSVAVFQNLDTEGKQDKMKAQVMELDDLLSKDKAILQMDGKFSIISSMQCESDSVIQISDDEDDGSDNLKCKICDQNFSTQKTLKFHMKYKHLESRLVYPCPDCLEIFSTSWSVYRHLFKVHRKSAAQIRRLRESIQAKAFKMNNPPAFYEKRKNMKPPTQKISEEERLDQENQAWMDNVEGDGSLPRCFGCGRTFERRAALAAHAHTCPPRTRALALASAAAAPAAAAAALAHAASRRPPETKKIEIQIRKDYNKGPAAGLNLPVKTDSEMKTSEEATVTPVLKEPSEKDSHKQFLNDILEEATMDIMDDDVKSNETDSPEKTSELTPQLSHKPTINLPFAQQAEKSNLMAFRQKIQPDIEVNTLLCKKCEIRHNTVQELYDHMASHYKWMRYACKLCNFKTYSFEKLPEHVRVVHKLKGDSEFYFSTVKAINGNEALELSENVEETSDINDVSPDSRRQSRCSSDSSRLSDDSSSSSTRIEGSRKRKMCHVKNSSKRKKDSNNDEDDDQKADMSLDKDSISMDNDTSSISKTFEENSSDMDDIDDRLSKRQSTETTSSVASRRPVRKKTKRKNEDFEYDLSNLLKMEAQGYRDSQSSVNTKSNQTKKKTNQQENQNYYEIINRDCCGALATLSKKSVENSTAHVKTVNFISATPKEPRASNVFARPMLPKSVSRGENKNSPKKDIVEDVKDSQSPQKEETVTKNPTEKLVTNSENDDKKCEEVKESPTKEQDCIKTVVRDALKTNLNNIPAVLPIKFRRQSLEFMKNPIINKNITDFKKAGMKTKILVIKPINRSKDGLPTTNAPLKFQTIKLKDPSKSSSSSEEKSSDQVVVVKVPKVDTIRTVADVNVLNTEKTKCVINNINSVNNNISDDKSNKTSNENDSVKSEETLKSDTSVNVPDSEESKSVSADKELKTNTDITEKVSDSCELDSSLIKDNSNVTQN